MIVISLYGDITKSKGKESFVKKKTKKPTAIEKTAYHEAGHAVAAFLLNHSFKYVTIVPDDDEGSLGHVMYNKFSDKFNPEINDDGPTRNIIEKTVMCSLAGPISEKILTKRSNHIGARSDYRNAVDMSSYMCGSSEEIEKYLDWIRVRTENTVKNPINWSAVKAIAEALLENKRLGAKKAREIIRDAIIKYMKRRNPNIGEIKINYK